MNGLAFRHPRTVVALYLILGLGISTFTGGCANSQLRNSATAQVNRTDIELVARDLLYVMAQLLEPNETTFQLGRPSTEFGLELERGFREIGYGLQRVNADQGPNFMNYTESTNVSNTGKNTFRFKVFIGDIGLERVYTQLDRVGLAPAGPMIVYGTRKSVVLSDLLFPEQSLDVVYRNGEDAVVDDSLITVFDAEVVSAIGELRNQSLPSYKTFNAADREIQNLFTRGSSNFEALGRDYRIVRREVIAFPDDSLFLLTKGRTQITKILKFYRSETDLIRVIRTASWTKAAGRKNQPVIDFLIGA